MTGILAQACRAASGRANLPAGPRTLDIAYPGEDGQLHTTTAKEGDFFVQNGAFHEFHNRSDDPCVILMFVFGAERKEA